MTFFYINLINYNWSLWHFSLQKSVSLLCSMDSTFDHWKCSFWLHLKSFWQSSIFDSSYSLMKIQVMINIIIRLQQKNLPGIEKEKMFYFWKKRKERDRKASILNKIINNNLKNYWILINLCFLKWRKYAFKWRNFTGYMLELHLLKR